MRVKGKTGVACLCDCVCVCVCVVEKRMGGNENE